MSRHSHQFMMLPAMLSLLLCTALCALGVEVHHPVSVGCLLALAIGWPTVWALHSWRQRLILQRRMAAGQCVACGYDLCATPDRCPECGRIPGTASA